METISGRRKEDATSIPLEPWYVTGLCDGEASFTYSRSGALALYFAIRMTAGERCLLNSLRAFFGGAGKLYTAKAQAPRRYSGHTKEAVFYRITSRTDLERVVDHFDAYPLQSAKVLQYEIWREMVLLKRGFSFNPRRSKNPPAAYLEHRERLEALAAQLSAACLRNQPWAASISWDIPMAEGAPIIYRGNAGRAP